MLRTATLAPHAIPGHLSIEEGEWLRKSAYAGRTLEIGGFRGRSTIYLASTSESLITCDHFLGQKTLLPHQNFLDMAMIERDWHKNLELSGLRNKVFLMHMDSAPCYRILSSAKETFDLIFVDGGHDAESVRNDTRFSKLLKKDGIIAFHDYNSVQFPAVNEEVHRWSLRSGSGFRRIASKGSIAAFRKT